MVSRDFSHPLAIGNLCELMKKMRQVFRDTKFSNREVSLVRIATESVLPAIKDDEVYQEWMSSVVKHGMNSTLVKARQRIARLESLDVSQVEEILKIEIARD